MVEYGASTSGRVHLVGVSRILRGASSAVYFALAQVYITPVPALITTSWSSTLRQRLPGHTWHQRRPCTQRQCQWLITSHQRLLCHTRRQFSRVHCASTNVHRASAGRDCGANTLDQVHRTSVSQLQPGVLRQRQ